MNKHAPLSIDDLSDSFLTQCLSRAGAISKSSVTGHEIIPLPEPGQTTDMAFIALSYDEAEAGSHSRLVAKFAVADPDAFEMAKAFGLYKREVRFFQKIGKDAGVRVPDCFYAAHDETSGKFLLLVEDLTGNREGNYVNPDIEMVEALVIEAAKMHSRWWQHEALHQYPWLSNYTDTGRIQEMSQMFLETVDTFIEKTADFINPYFLRCHQAMKSHPLALEELGRAPHTLIHGDLHVKNAFFTSDKQTFFIDWQMAGIGNPCIDFIRPLTAVKTSDQQRIPDLMQRYLEILHAGGVTDYSMQQLERDTIVGLMYGWMLESTALAQSDLDIISAYIESKNGDIREIWRRGAELSERFQLAEFVETF